MLKILLNNITIYESRKKNKLNMDSELEFYLEIKGILKDEHIIEEVGI